jgi:hypothetical protein
MTEKLEIKLVSETTYDIINKNQKNKKLGCYKIKHYRAKKVEGENFKIIEFRGPRGGLLRRINLENSKHPTYEDFGNLYGKGAGVLYHGSIIIEERK